MVATVKLSIAFGDFVDRIYPIELEIKDTTDTDRSASYLDLYFEIDSEGRLRTKLYDKRDDFNFVKLYTVYSIQLYVIKCFIDFQQNGGVFQQLRFSTPMKLTYTI
jgi:hypothetical protein